MLPTGNFTALRVTEISKKSFQRAVVERSIEDLPPGDVLVRVLYSSLNYKDALSASGNRGVTRHYPHTPGIDAAGIVAESKSASFHPEQEQYLRELGARNILPREALQGNTDRLLLRETWAGIIDTVGGEILANAIKTTMYGGAVTCCGNVAGPEINLNVYPFILRGITLIGIDSANCAMDTRTSLWQKLAGAWKIPRLNDLCNEISLTDLDQHIDLILQGKQRGRVIINLWS